jgi:DNA-directed RNA polymerase subunit RPC12/RpoP
LTNHTIKVYIEGMLKIYQCTRCKWDWASRNPTAPKVCPKCKSPYWYVERGILPRGGSHHHKEEGKS